MQHAISNINDLSDLQLLEVITMCADYKHKAIAVKCSKSSKEWRAFCLAQLTKGGARILHRFVNRQNAPQPVAMFKPDALGKRAHTPNDALQQDAAHWAKFWSLPGPDRVAHKVFDPTSSPAPTPIDPKDASLSRTDNRVQTMIANLSFEKKSPS